MFCTLQEGRKGVKKLLTLPKICLQSALKFVSPDKDSVGIVVPANASFAPNKSLKSQLFFMVGLADKQNKENIVDYSSFEYKHVTRRVLTSERFAVAQAFDCSAR